MLSDILAHKTELYKTLNTGKSSILKPLNLKLDYCFRPSIKRWLEKWDWKWSHQNRASVHANAQQPASWFFEESGILALVTSWPLYCTEKEKRVCVFNARVEQYQISAGRWLASTLLGCCLWSGRGHWTVWAGRHWENLDLLPIVFKCSSPKSFWRCRWPGSFHRHTRWFRSGESHWDG